STRKNWRDELESPKYEMLKEYFLNFEDDDFKYLTSELLMDNCKKEHKIVMKLFIEKVLKRSSDREIKSKDPLTRELCMNFPDWYIDDLKERIYRRNWGYY